MSIKWYGVKVLESLKKEMNRRLQKIALHIVSYIKKSISIGNRGVGKRRNRNPSRPGEPPHVVTGTLRANVSYEIAPNYGDPIAYVGIRRGAADAYAKALEESGIRDGTTRPFLRPAIMHNRAVIISMMRGR